LEEETMPAQPIPEDHEGLIPSLVVDGAAEAIEFYKRAFDAREHGRMEGPEGTVAHAELEIAGTRLMLADPFPQSPVKPPGELGGTAGSVFMYVEDVDAAVQRAVDAGATVVMPVDDMFWGDRWGMIADPYGHRWELATHVEDVSPEEMEKRGREAMAAMG
jgi:PhnB protein